MFSAGIAPVKLLFQFLYVPRIALEFPEEVQYEHGRADDRDPDYKPQKSPVYIEMVNQETGDKKSNHHPQRRHDDLC